MPVPSDITELSTTAGANYPAGTENANTVDDYLRQYAAFIADLRTRYVNVVDYAGADLGAKLQAAYDARLAICNAGDGLGAGIGIFIPPNPDGDHWVLSTAVDLSSGGFVHILGMAGTYIELGADLTYMIRTGVTNKSNRVIIENLTFKPAGFTADSAILIGGGTQIELRSISFQKTPVTDTGSFTDGILIDRDQDGDDSGVTFSRFEGIYDSGGSACTNSMIKARGLVSSVIKNVRVGQSTTYGVYLDSTPGAVQSNLIEMVCSETGAASTSALVCAHASVSAITGNTIRTLSGNTTAGYGFLCAGGGTIEDNIVDVDDTGLYETAAFNDGGTIARKKNLTRELGTFTPTWSGASVNPAVGDGSLVAKYYRVGDVVHVTYTLAAGAGTTFGTGQYAFTLPAHLPAAATYAWYGQARAYDDSGGSPFILGNAVISGGGTTVTAEFPAGYWAPAVPMTWANGDQMAITITYGI